jgi:hypothetical protein
MNFASASKFDRKSGVRWGERGAPVQFPWGFVRIRRPIRVELLAGVAQAHGV